MRASPVRSARCSRLRKASPQGVVHSPSHTWVGLFSSPAFPVSSICPAGTMSVRSRSGLASDAAVTTCSPPPAVCFHSPRKNSGGRCGPCSAAPAGGAAPGVWARTGPSASGTHTMTSVATNRRSLVWIMIPLPFLISTMMLGRCSLYHATGDASDVLALIAAHHVWRRQFGNTLHRDRRAPYPGGARRLCLGHGFDVAAAVAVQDQDLRHALSYGVDGYAWRVRNARHSRLYRAGWSRFIRWPASGIITCSATGSSVHSSRADCVRLGRS